METNIEQQDSTENNVDTEKLQAQAPLDAIRTDQSVAEEEEQSVGIGMIDASTKGLTARMLGQSKFRGSVFLESKEDAIIKFNELGVEEQYHDDIYARYEKQYKDVKNDMFSTNQGTVKSLTDMQHGYTAMEQVNNDIYKNYNGAGVAPVTFANQYTYLDRSKKKVWNEESQAFEEQDMGFMENVWNNDLVFGQDFDKLGRPIDLPYQRETKPGEDWYSAQSVSAFSNPNVWGNSWHQQASGLASGFVVSGSMKLFGLVGELASNLITMAPRAVVDSYLKSNPDSEGAQGVSEFLNSGQTAFNQVTKMADRWEYRPSDEVMQSGFTGGGMFATTYHASKVIGEFLPQVLAAYGSMGSSLTASISANAARAMAKEVLKKGAVKDLSSRLLLGEGVKAATQKAAGRVFGMSQHNGIRNLGLKSFEMKSLGVSQAVNRGTQLAVNKGAQTVMKGTASRTGAEVAVRKGASEATELAIRKADKVFGNVMASKLQKETVVGVIGKSLKGNLLRANQKFMLMGTMQATGMNYFEMRKNGISQDMATGVAMALSPIMYATERVVGIGYLRSMYGVTGMQVAAKEFLKNQGLEVVSKAQGQAFSKVLGGYAKNAKNRLKSIKGVKDLTKAFNRDMVNNIAKSTGKSLTSVKEIVAEGVKKAPNVGTRSLFGKTPGKLIGKIDEWEQLYDEHQIIKNADGFLKYLSGKGNPITMAKSAMAEGTQEGLEQVGYILGYYVHDNLLAEDGATKGRGKMGYESWKDDVMSKRTWHELKENFIGGAIAGGTISGFMGGGGGKYNADYLFIQAAQKGETEILDAYYRQLFESDPASLGSTEHDPEFGVLTKNGTDKVWMTVDKDYEAAGLTEGQELKSQAEIQYYQIIKNNHDIKELYEETGLGINAMKRFTEYNSMFYNGLDVFRDLKEKRANLAALEAELKDAEGDVADDLTGKIEGLKKETEALAAQYEYLMVADESGYSKGYKDSIKAAKTFLSMANEEAASQMKLRDKYKVKDDTQEIKFSEKDVAEFMKQRDLYAEKTEDINLYARVKMADDRLEQWASVIGESNSAAIYEAMKAMTDEEVGVVEEMKTSLNELEYLTKNFADGKTSLSFIKRNNILANITTMARSVSTLATSSANPEITNVFDNLRKQINSVQSNIETDVVESMMESSARKYVSELDEDGNAIGTKILDTPLTQDDEGFNAAMSDKQLSMRLSSRKSIDEAFNSKTSQDENIKGIIDHAKNYGYYDSAVAGDDVPAEAILKLKDDVYLNAANELLQDLKNKEKTDFRNEPDIKELLDTVKLQIEELDMIKDAFKVRAVVFSELSKSEKYNKMLEPKDRLIDPKLAELKIDNATREQEQLKSYITILEQKVGQRSDYYKKSRHRRTIMDRHFLTALFDLAKVKAIIPSDAISKLEALKFTPIKDTPYTVEEESEIAANEKAINEIINVVNEHREQLKDKDIIKDLLTSTFLEPHLYDDTASNAYYNNAIAYDEFNRNSYIDKIATSQIDVGYGMYTGIENFRNDLDVIAYTDLVNNLVKVLSDAPPTQAASTRLQYYESNTVVSSIEQIVPENEIYAWLHGGMEVLQTVRDVEELLDKGLFHRPDLDLFNSRSAFLGGDVQTGKSAQVIPEILKMSLINGKYKKTVLVANSKETLNNFSQLRSDLISQGLIGEGDIEVVNKTGFVKKETLDGFNDEALILFDEASILNDSELKMLNDMYLGKDSTNAIIYIGDDAQMPSIVGKDATGTNNIIHTGFRSTPTKRKYATGNPMLSDFMDLNGRNVGGFIGETEALPPYYYEEKDGKLRGIQYFSSIKDIVSKGIERVNAGVSSEEMTITFLTEKAFENYKEDNPSHGAFLESHKEFVTVLSNDNDISTDIQKFDSIQGGRRDEVYIAFDGTLESFNESVEGRIKGYSLVDKAMYTLSGRAIDYIATVGDVNNEYNSRPASFNVAPEAIEGFTKETKDETIKHLSDIYSGNPTNETVSKKKGAVPNQTASGVKFTDAQKAGLERLDEIAEVNEPFKDGLHQGFQVYSKGDQIRYRVTATMRPKGTTFEDLMAFHDKNTKESSNETKYGKNKSGEIGVGADSIYRDVIDYRSTLIKDEKNINYDELWARHKNLTYDENGVSKPVFAETQLGSAPKAYMEYINELVKFKNELTLRGEIPYANTIRLQSEAASVMGTPDLITIDRDGKLRVYDLKSKNANSAQWLNKESKFNFTGEEGKGMTDLDKHAMQLSAYQWLLLEEGFTKEDFAKTNTLNVITVQFDYTSKKGMGIQSVDGFKVIPVNYKAFNIGRGNEEIGNTWKPANTNNKGTTNKSEVEILEDYITDNGFEISVTDGNNIYKNKKSGKEVEVISITKTGNKIMVRFKSEHGAEAQQYSVMFSKHFDPVASSKPKPKVKTKKAKKKKAKKNNTANKKKVSVEYDIEIAKEEDEVVEDDIVDEVVDVIEDVDVVGDVVDGPIEAANAAENDLFYSTPVSIHPSSSASIEMLEKLDADDIERIKAIKATIYTNLKKKLELVNGVAIFGDDGMGKADNVLRLVFDEPDARLRNEVTTAINKLTKTDPSYKTLLARAIGSDPVNLRNEFYSLFNVAGTLSSPRVYDEANNRFVKLGRVPTEHDISRAGRQYQKETLSDDTKKIILYNIKLMKLHIPELFNTIPKGFVKISTTSPKSRGKVSQTATVGELMVKLRVKGFDVNNYERVTHVTADGTSLMAFKFQGPNGYAIVPIFTPTIDEGDTLMKTDVYQRLNEELKLLEDGRGINPTKTMAYSFLMSNKSFFDGKLSTTVPGTSITFDQLISGKHYNFQSKYHKNIEEANKEQIKNLIIFTKFLNQIKNAKGVYGTLRLPYSKEMPTENLRSFFADVNQKPGYSDLKYVMQKIEGEASKSTNENTGEVKRDADGGYNIDELFNSVRTENSLYDPIAHREASSVVEKILGDRYSKEWTGFTRKDTFEGTSVFGLMINGKIKYVTKGGMVNRHTIRHEIFHVVDEYFLGEDSKEKMYSIVRENVEGMAAATEREIKEWLADWYGTFGHIYQDLENIDEAYLARYKTLLESVKDRYIMFSGEFAQLFQKMENGGFKENAERLIDSADIETVRRLSVNNRKDRMDRERNRKKKQGKKIKEQKQKSNKDAAQETKAEKPRTVHREVKKNEAIKNTLRNISIDSKELTDAQYLTKAYEKTLSVFGSENSIALALGYFRFSFNFKSQLNGGTNTFEDLLDMYGAVHKNGNKTHSFANNYMNATVSVTRNGKVESISVADAVADDFVQMNEADRSKYSNYYFLNNPLVSKYFLKMMFRSYNLKENNLGTNPSAYFGEDRTVDVDEGSNDYVKWFATTFVVYKRHGNGYNKDSMKKIFIAEDEIRNILKQASSRASVLMTDDISDVDNFYYALNQALDEMMPNLSEASVREGMTREELNSVIGTDITLEDKVYSVKKKLFLGHESPTAKGVIKFNPLISETGYIETGTQEATDLITAMMSSFQNAKVGNHLKINMPKNNKPTITNVNTSNSVTFKNSLKDNMMSNLYNNGLLTDVVLNTFNKVSNNRTDDKRIEFTKKGHLMYDGNKILTAESDGTYSFVKDGKHDKPLTAAMTLINIVGLSDFSKNIVDRLLQDDLSLLRDLNIADVSKITGADELTAPQLLATVLGNYMQILNNAVTAENIIVELQKTYTTNNSKWAEDFTKVEEFNEELKDKLSDIKISPQLNAFMDNINFKHGSESFIKDVEDVVDLQQVSQLDLNYLKPDEFFTYVDALADVLYTFKGKALTSRYYIGGKNIPVTEQSNNITDTFETEPYSTQASSLRTSNKEIQIHALFEGADSPAISSNGTSNSIFASDMRRDGYGIWHKSNSGRQKDVIVEAIRSFHAIEKGSQNYDNLQGDDIVKLMYDVFLTAAKKNSNKIVFPIGYTTKIRFVDMTLSKSNLNIKFDKKGALEVFDFHPSMFRQSMQKNFDFYAGVTMKSHERFNNLEDNSESALWEYIQRGSQNTWDVNAYEAKALNKEGILISEEEKAYIRNSGLINGSDYIIEKDDLGNSVFKFGSDYMYGVPGSTTYTLDNYFNVTESLEKDGLLSVEIMEEVLTGEMALNNSRFHEGLYKDVYGINNFFKKTAKAGEYKTSSALKATNSKGEVLYNPVVQYMSYAYASFMPQVLGSITGNESLYTDIFDYNKRFDVNNTPMSKLKMGVKNGVGTSAKILIIEDTISSRNDVKERKFDKDGNVIYSKSTVKNNDGGGRMSTMFNLAMRNSVGNDMSIFDDTIYKPLIRGSNPHTHHNLVTKFGFDPVSDLLMQQNTELREQQQDFRNHFIKNVAVNMKLDLSAVYEKYDDGTRSFIEVDQAVLEEIHNIESPFYDTVRRSIVEPKAYINEVLSNIVMGSVPISSVKTGASNISNSQTPFEDVNGVDVSMDNFGLISNFGASINEASDVAMMNQALGHIGINNPELADKVFTALNEILDEGYNDLFDDAGLNPDITTWENQDYEVFKEYLNELAIEATSNDIGNLTFNAALREDVILDAADTAFKVASYYTAKFNKRIKPRLKGARYTQADASMLTTYRDKSGNTINRLKALELDYIDSDDNITVEGRDIGLTRSKLGYMHHENGVFHAGEIALGFVNAKTFGIEEGQQPEDAFYVYTEDNIFDVRNFLAEMRGEDNDTKISMLKAKIEEEYGGEIIEYNPDDSFNNHPYLRVSELTKLLKKDDPNIKGVEITSDIAYEMASYMVNFDESLDVVASRVPYDTPSLGFSARVTQFVWGNGNAVYINPLENIRTGADQDIDQLSIYFRSFNGAFLKPDNNVEGEEFAANKNVFVESMYSYYADEANSKISYQVTGTDEIESALVKNKAKSGYHQMISIVDMHNITSDGAQAIGILSNFNSAYAYHQQLQGFMNFEAIQVQQGYVQSALDNEKKVILGRFGVPKELMGMLGGFSAMNLSYKDTLYILNNKRIKQMHNEFRRGRYVFEKSIGIQELFYTTKAYEQKNYETALSTTRSYLESIRNEESKSIFNFDTDALLNDMNSPVLKVRDNAFKRFIQLQNAAKGIKYKAINTARYKSVVDISSTGKGSAFNNYSSRPFTINSETNLVAEAYLNTTGEQLEVDNVAAALQIAKLNYVNSESYIKDGVLTNLGMSYVTSWAERTSENWNDTKRKVPMNMDGTAWQEGQEEILKEFVRDSFNNNPDVKTQLLTTGTHYFDAKISNNKTMNERVARVLAEVRNEYYLENGMETLELQDTKDMMGIQKATATVLSAMNKIKYHYANDSALNKYEEAMVALEFYKSLSNVIGLRNGFISNFAESKLKTRRMELGLGQSVEDFVSGRSVDENGYIKYYKEHSNEHNRADEDLKKHLEAFRRKVFNYNDNYSKGVDTVGSSIKQTTTKPKDVVLNPHTGTIIVSMKTNSLSRIPNKAKVGFEAKKVKHITAIPFSAARMIKQELAKLPVIQKEIAEKRLKELYDDFEMVYSGTEKFFKVKKHYAESKYIDGSGKEVVNPAHDREAIIEMLDSTSINQLFSSINTILKSSIPVPIPHVTLMSKGHEHGIAITSKAEFKSADKEVIEAKKRRKKKVLDSGIKSPGQLLAQNSYLVDLVRKLESHNMTLSGSLLPFNSKIDSLERKVAVLQEDLEFVFENQINVLTKVANELLISTYLSKAKPLLSTAVPRRVSMKYEKGYKHLLNMSLENTEVAAEFRNNFPSLARDMKNLINSTPDFPVVRSYFNAINIKITQNDYNILMGSNFFDALEFDSEEGFLVMRINPTISYDGNASLEYKNEFQKLPLKLQKMFEMYHILNSRLKSSAKGLGRILTNNIRVDMKKEFSVTELQDMVDEFVADEGARFSDKISFDPSIRKMYREGENPNMVTMPDSNSFYAPMKAQVFTGSYNEMSPIYEDALVRVYKGNAHFGEKPHILRSINRIKLGTVLNNELQNGAEDVLYTTFSKHGYKTGVHVTEYGELVNVTTIRGSLTSLYVSKFDGDVAKEMESLQGNTLLKNSRSRISFGKQFTEIVAEEKTTFRFYESIEDAESSQFKRTVESRNQSSVNMEHISGTYRLYVTPLEMMTKAEFMAMYNQSKIGVKDGKLAKVTGINSGLKNSKAIKSFINGEVGSPSHMYVLKIENDGEINEDRTRIFETIMNLNDKNC